MPATVRRRPRRRRPSPAQVLAAEGLIPAAEIIAAAEMPAVASPVVTFPPQPDLDWNHPANGRVTIVDAAKAIVRETDPDGNPKKKVAIVGFASSSRMWAPFNDPAWSVWSVNQCNRYIPRADRWFEIHNRPMFEADIVRDTDYVGWLRTCRIPVYMSPLEFDASTLADIPMAVRFPIEAAEQKFGVEFVDQMMRVVDKRPFFTSTPAYMIALAIMEGFEEIGIWGIDLVVGREWSYEQPCASYFLGWVRALGIKLTLPNTTALLKASHRYGIDPEPTPGPLSLDLLRSRERALQERRGQLVGGLNSKDGAIEEARHWQAQAERTDEALKAREILHHEQKASVIAELHAVDGALQENAYWQSAIDLADKGATILMSSAGP